MSETANGIQIWVREGDKERLIKLAKLEDRSQKLQFKVLLDEAFMSRGLDPETLEGRENPTPNGVGAKNES